MLSLGISCYYHDSAAVIADRDRIIFGIQEERLTRRKHDPGFPTLAIGHALQAAGAGINDVDNIIFYEEPQTKLRRLWDQVLDGWPRSSRLFFEGLPRFIKYKLPVEEQIRKHLGFKGPVQYVQHHRSHAASAFYTSPFERAIVLTVDGVGEYDTTAVHIGEGNRLNKVRSIHFPDSLGLLYSVFTDYLGFEVNEGEYKVMGLASYGKPRYLEKIVGPVISLKDDGSFTLNSAMFDFNGSEHHYTRALVDHVGVPPRAPGAAPSEEHVDLAASVQAALELALARLVDGLSAEFGTKDFCFAGGVALNCTANAMLVRDGKIRSHIHPAAGDAGGALGAALLGQIGVGATGEPRRYDFSPYLGMDYSEGVAKTTLSQNNVSFERPEDIVAEIARRLAHGEIVAIVNGRDEWGPRALGARSILADPRSAGMKNHLNAKIKFREEFRPFAPVVKVERYAEYFETLGMSESPYMLYTHRARKPSEIPAVVHVDGTSRVQTVSEFQNPYLYGILDAFERYTGVPVLVNTSFNLRGEPMVSSPSDALKTFFESGIDSLAVGQLLVDKSVQRPH